MIAGITPAKKLQSTPQEATVQLKGICATCIHMESCAYVETPKNPKLYCEQFESDVVPNFKATNVAALKAIPEMLKRESEKLKQARALGLCANCAHSETCVFPRPEGGVWHCEEYC